MKKRYSDLLGYAAMAMILMVGIMVSSGRLQIGRTYFSVGIVLGTMMALHGWERRSPPIVILNGAYALINVWGLVRVL